MILTVPIDIINNTPSSKHGVDPFMEEELRIYGCNIIFNAGLNLLLKSVTIASAQAILQRFYYRRSLTDFDIRKTAAAATFLSTKLEEDPKRIREVIMSFFITGGFQHDPPLTNNYSYCQLRDDILRCEIYILRELGFMVSQALLHPHRYILQYVYALFKNLGDYSQYTVKDMAQKAWDFLSDSSKTSLCCQVQPWVIAAGSIYLAAKALGINLSQVINIFTRESKWYAIFDTTWEEIQLVSVKIASIGVREEPEYFDIVNNDAVVSSIIYDNDFQPTNFNARKSNKPDINDIMNTTDPVEREKMEKKILRRKEREAQREVEKEFRKLHERKGYRVGKKGSAEASEYQDYVYRG